MRLIDADEIRKSFDENTWQGELMIAVIDNSPTAYDVEMVVRELNSYHKDNIPLRIAIDMVKGGNRYPNHTKENNMKYERLTARNKNGFAYLVNIKDGEQEVNSEYQNTMKCILDCFKRLAEYEEIGLSPSQLSEMVKRAEDDKK